MNTLLDNFLVGVILLASLGYAFYKLGPRAWRQRILQALGRALAGAPAYLRLGRVAQRLDAALAGKSPGACGGCDNCGTESSAPQSSSAEINIPVRKIGRRV
jgi:uncharacterized protein DUF6587